MKKIALLAVVALLSLGLVTACGGGGGAGQTLNVVAGEGGSMTYMPDTFKAKKGDKITVNFTNKDASQNHNFLITELNANSGQIKPGASKTFNFTATKSGEFVFFCDVPGHKEGGMFGKITVAE